MHLQLSTMTNVKAHCTGVTHISTRLGGVMSASILGKARVTAGCFPIASYVIERIIVFRWGKRGENNCVLDIFYYFQLFFFYFVEIPTIKSKPERLIKNLVCY